MHFAGCCRLGPGSWISIASQRKMPIRPNPFGDRLARGLKSWERWNGHRPLGDERNKGFSLRIPKLSILPSSFGLCGRRTALLAKGATAKQPVASRFRPSSLEMHHDVRLGRFCPGARSRRTVCCAQRNATGTRFVASFASAVSPVVSRWIASVYVRSWRDREGLWVRYRPQGAASDLKCQLAPTMHVKFCKQRR